jgi:N-acetylmuramoyl-L-alanine amidase
LLSLNQISRFASICAISEYPDDSRPMANVRDDIVASDDHMKEMWAGKSNVLVCVRVRPLMKHDKIQKNIVRVLDRKVVVVLDPAHGDKGDILRANRNREKQYAFDYAFDPTSSHETTSTIQRNFSSMVFSMVITPLVRWSLMIRE